MSTKKLLPTFPITFARCEGAWLFDNHDKAYLDCLSGIAVTGFGHNHPRVTETICKQAHRVLHTSNIFPITAQEELAEELTRIRGISQAFFVNLARKQMKRLLNWPDNMAIKKELKNLKLLCCKEHFMDAP